MTPADLHTRLRFRETLYSLVIIASVVAMVGTSVLHHLGATP